MVNASTQDRMSVISTTRFLEVDTSSLPSKNACGSVFWVLMFSASKSANIALYIYMALAHSLGPITNALPENGDAFSVGRAD